jgi:CRISPR-associated protein Cmr3
MSNVKTWALAPHDPLVLGIGRRLPALLPRMTRAVPLPATLAGAIRAQYAHGRVNLSHDEAWKLLNEVSLRGPWLQKGDEIYVRAPLHVRAHGDEDKRTVAFPGVQAFGANEGALLLDGAPASMRHYVHWELPKDAHKVKPLDEFLPLDTVRDLLLGTHETNHSLGKPETLFEFEGRVHVTVNQLTQTAEPGALYSSSGVRYADDVTIGVEITTTRGDPTQNLFVLGGETRPVAQRKGRDFPAFNEHKSSYEKAAQEHKDRPFGLLLMLVTPASFSTKQGDSGAGWLPSWLKDGHGEVKGMRLTLETIATDRFVPFSGWSMGHRNESQQDVRQGRQRAVRRLVPAGTVYFLRLENGGLKEWLALCEHFWGKPIDEHVGSDENELIPEPWRDGYGMVIPGLYWPDGAKP